MVMLFSDTVEPDATKKSELDTIAESSIEEVKGEETASAEEAVSKVEEKVKRCTNQNHELIHKDGGHPISNVQLSKVQAVFLVEVVDGVSLQIDDFLDTSRIEKLLNSQEQFSKDIATNGEFEFPSQHGRMVSLFGQPLLEHKPETRLDRGFLTSRAWADNKLPNVASNRNAIEQLSAFSFETGSTIDPSGKMESSVWYFHVTGLCLDNLHLNSVEMLKKLPSLRWLSLNGNFITDISPLFEMRQLESLSMTDNTIIREIQVPKMDLSYLQYLDVSNTGISSVEFCYTRFDCLVVLVSSANCITSGNGLEGLHSLERLHICFNNISEVEIFDHLLASKEWIFRSAFLSVVLSFIESEQIGISGFDRQSTLFCD